ncbi:MAG: hypothetical protein AB8H79_22855 [Myxococcota bacterium]
MTELDRLLRQIADGDGSAPVVERAKALLLYDERLPPDLRECGLDDDEPDVAASALLGVLGLDDGLFAGLLGAAVRSEAADSDVPAVEHAPLSFAELMADATQPDALPITAQDLAAQEAEGVVPVADAVRALAGEPDLSLSILHRLGVRPMDVAAAVLDSAGDVDVAVDVSTRLGALAAPLAPALQNEAGDVDVAASVVAPLGAVLWPVAAAIRSEAGEIDVAHLIVPSPIAVASAVRFEAGDVDLVAALAPDTTVDVAAAVRSEAPEVDVWSTMGQAFEPGWVSGLFDGELSPVAHRIAARRLMTDGLASVELSAFAEAGRNLRHAVTEGAGETPYIWAAVAPRIGIEHPEAVPGWEEGVVAEAVRDRAGTVAVEQAVMDRVQRKTDRVTAPPVVVQTAAPANNGRWRMAGMAIAAAVLVSVLAGRLLPMAGLLAPGAAGLSAEPVDFAAAGEVQVEELSYDDEVNVMVTLPDEDGDRPLIIRINEEV